MSTENSSIPVAAVQPEACQAGPKPAGSGKSINITKNGRGYLQWQTHLGLAEKDIFPPQGSVELGIKKAEQMGFVPWAGLPHNGSRYGVDARNGVPEGVEGVPAIYGGGLHSIRMTDEQPVTLWHNPKKVASPGVPGEGWRFLVVGEKVPPGSQYWNWEFDRWDDCEGALKKIGSLPPHKSTTFRTRHPLPEIW